MALMKEINEKVYKIIGSCMEVHKALGPGYPSEFYKKALELEMPSKGLDFETSKQVQVQYKEAAVGTVTLDFLIGKDVVLTVKSEETLKDVEVQQMLRLIALSGGSMGVIVNFGLSKIQYKRVLPNYQPREIRKDVYRHATYREIGKTREGNPLL